MNKVQLVGRLAKDPESRSAGNTDITTIIVATDRPRFKDGANVKGANGYPEKDTEFHKIICFNGLGRAVAKNREKGDVVAVDGRIHYTRWTDQGGETRYGCEIIADSVDFF